MINKKEFWEKKIISWENGRYKLREENSNLLENFSDNLSSSLEYRQKFALELLKISPNKDLTVLELGCGSGLIAKQVLNLGFKKYIGIDISEKAINRAKKINLDYSEKIQFYSSNTNFSINKNVGTVFSLGLFDWLENNEIKEIFQRYNNSFHLHSISEKQTSLYQLLHKLYVFLSYGYRSKGYKPKYHTLEDIKELYSSKNKNKLHIFNNSKLKFGAFIKNYE